jgi:hypothetical protein
VPGDPYAPPAASQPPAAPLPYGQQPPASPYGPPQQPYGQQPYSTYGQQPYNPYGQQPYSMPQQSSKPIDGMAVVALITGIFLAFFGIITGVMALNRIKNSDSGGKALAIAGIVLGFLGTLGWGIIAVFVIFVANADGPSPSVDPFSYGDDPVLDALWDDCEAGNMQACDDLYDQSVAGSDYDEFADTCGFRQDAGTGLLCTSLGSALDPSSNTEIVGIAVKPQA